MQQPQFDYGEQVRVVRHLRNDGTFPGRPTGSLLIRRGSVGYVRDVGHFLQDQVIYAVHFLPEDVVVGCRETELQPGTAAWVESQFETREQVSARITLASNGRVLVNAGAVGEVVDVLRDRPDGVVYHVQFPGCNVLEVPESALEGVA